MNNLKPSRTGFQFEHVLSTEGAKRKVILLSVMYLKSSNGNKGVLASIRPTEIEQCDGYTSESTLLYNEANVSQWMRMLARKNDKAVLEVAMLLDPHVAEIIAAYQVSPANGKAMLASYAGLV